MGAVTLGVVLYNDAVTPGRILVAPIDLGDISGALGESRDRSRDYSPSGNKARMQATLSAR
jgi:hypothetical protein